jgi:hypothetical protein
MASSSRFATCRRRWKTKNQALTGVTEAAVLPGPLAESDYARTRTAAVPEPALPELLESLEALCLDLGERRGWHRNSISAVNRALKLLLATQDTPGAPITSSTVPMLRAARLPVQPTIEVLKHAGFLVDDRTPAVATWVERKTAHLPATMRAELAVWFEVSLNGSTTTPRRRPCSHRTIRNHIYAVLPALTTWASTKESLREVTRDDVLTVLPTGATHHSEMMSGLRSIFQILLARKLVFANPTARMRVGSPRSASRNRWTFPSCAASSTPRTPCARLSPRCWSSTACARANCARCA